MGFLTDILDGIVDTGADIAGDVFGVLDAPRGAIATGLGAVDYGTSILANRYLDPVLPDFLFDPVSDDELANTRRLWEEGGGRAVWEGNTVDYIPNMVPDILPDSVVRGLVDIGIDPLTYAAGIGLFGKGLRATANTGSLAGRAQQGIGTALDVAGTIGKTPDLAVEATARGIGRGATWVANTGPGSKTILPLAQQANKRLISPVATKARAVADLTGKVWSKNEKLSKLFELTPAEQRGKQFNEIMDTVRRSLAGSDTNRARGRDYASAATRDSQWQSLDQAQFDLPASGWPEGIGEADRANAAIRQQMADTLSNPMEGDTMAWRGSPGTIDLAQGNREPQGFATNNRKPIPGSVDQQSVRQFNRKREARMNAMLPPSSPLVPDRNVPTSALPDAPTLEIPGEGAVKPPYNMHFDTPEEFVTEWKREIGEDLTPSEVADLYGMNGDELRQYMRDVAEKWYSPAALATDTPDDLPSLFASEREQQVFEQLLSDSGDDIDAAMDRYLEWQAPGPLSPMDKGAQVAGTISEWYDGSRLKRGVDVLFPDGTPPTEQGLRASGDPAYEHGLGQNLQPTMLQEGQGPKPWLSDEENNVIYGHVMSTGESVGEAADRMMRELASDQMYLEHSGIRWEDTLTTEPGTNSLKSKLSLTKDKELKDIIRKWHDLGLTPSRSLEQNVEAAIATQLRDDLVDPVYRKRTWYDKAKTVWGEQALASGRYPFSNFVTNMTDSMITGHWNFASPIDVFKYAAREMKGASIDEIATGTKLDEVLSEYGVGNQSFITGGGFRDNIGSGRKSQTRAVLEKLGGGKLAKLANLVEAPLALAQGGDVMARSAVFEDVMDKGFEEGRAELLGKLDRIADNARFDTTGLTMLPSKDPAFLYEYYKSIGIEDGYAQRMSREVATLRNKALKEAQQEVERIFLSYRKTNADEMVAKFVPFHYWASRKVRFYAEEAMRNPALMAGYMRAVQGLDRTESEGGLSGRQKGFLKLMGGPTGFTLLMNPDAMMGVIKATGLQDNYTPEGETEIGGIIRRLKKNGVGLYPWIDGIVNMMGTYGNTFEPDVLGIRHRAVVGSVVNWMRGEGFFGEGAMQPGASPYADMSLEAREALSSWASDFLPDWLSQPVTVKEGGSPGQASLDQIIQSRIMAENPEMTNGELALIMSDPDSEQYRSAFQDAARAGVIGQMMSFMLPAQFRVDENTRDVRGAQIDIIDKEAEKRGINPYEMTYSSADAEFRAAYKNATGNDFKDDDYQTAKFKNELTRAAPGARQFVVWEHEYNQVADQIAPGVMDQFYGIMFGSKNPPGMSAIQAETLTPEQRQQAAEQWAVQSGNKPKIDLINQMQQAYEAQHPQFAQFKTWARDMRSLRSAYGGSLAEYRAQVSKQNPYAANFFARQAEWLKGRGYQDAQLAEALDQMTMSPSAWYAIAGQPTTVYDQKAQPTYADPQQAMASPFDQGGYTNPQALMPTQQPMQDMLMGQQMQTLQSGPQGYIGGMMEPQPPAIDWAAEARRRSGIV